MAPAAMGAVRRLLLHLSFALVPGGLELVVLRCQVRGQQADRGQGDRVVGEEIEDGRQTPRGMRGESHVLTDSGRTEYLSRGCVAPGWICSSVAASVRFLLDGSVKVADVDAAGLWTLPDLWKTPGARFPQGPWKTPERAFHERPQAIAFFLGNEKRRRRLR
jgi:hypothetical protein